MSKSLGNVLDPFAVIERFGADALRYYCCARSRSARTARSRPRGFEAALRDASWPTSYGNLASRTLAMIARYRDGAVPDGRARRRARRGLRRAWPTRVAELLDGAELTAGARRDLAARAAPQPLRRGARAVAARQGRGAGRRARRRAARRSPRGCACVTVLLHPYMPASTEQAARRRSGSPRLALRRRARLGAGSGDPRRRRSSRCSRSSRRAAATRASARDRLPHPPRLLRAAERRAARAARRGRRAADAHRRHGRRLCRAALRAAEAFPQVCAAIGRHPEQRDRLRRRRPGRARGARRARALRARSARPGLDFYRDRAPREDQERAFAAQIELARDDAASRS